MFLGLHMVYLMLYLNLPSSHSYNFTCPVAGHWKLRAKDYCPALPTDKYFCLYDVIHEYYTEGCRGPDWERTGSKRVISGHFTRGECSEDRYQPFDFRTDGNSDCVYLKSLCSGEGEIISSNGSGNLDRTCRCDFSPGYSFVQTPKNKWECRPSKEDCSCIRINNSVIEIEGPKAEASGDNNVTITNNELSIKDVFKEKVLDTRRDRRIGGIVMVVACLVMLIGSIIFLLCVLDDEFTSKIDSKVLRYLQTKIYQTDLNEADLCSTERKEKRRQTSMESQESGASYSSSEAYEKAPDDLDNVQLSSLDTSGASYASFEANKKVFKEEKSLTKEEVNYLRVLHLLFVVATPLVRFYFNAEIKPDKQKTTTTTNSVMHKVKKNESWILNAFTPTKGKRTPNTKKRRSEQNINTEKLTKGKHEGEILSEDYDLKSMILQLKQLKIISISDRLPMRTDIKPDALMGRILHYRNIIVDAVDGSLSDSEFKNFWSDIGQTLLRLATRYLTEINEKTTSKKLKEHLLALSLIKDNDPRLQRYVLLTERFPQLILQQLLREYCEVTYKDETMISFLEDEKHTLFHKRKDQYYCCSDRCGETSFANIIPKDVWNRFYMHRNNEITHTCKHPQKCSLRYEVNFNFDLSQACTSDLIFLVLNTPRLLRFTVRQMYKDSLRLFLDNNKHVLFHSVKDLGDNQCCICRKNKSGVDVKALLTVDNWEKLFQQVETTCDDERCCCQYSPNDVDVVHLDDTLLFKIFNLTGPFHTFAKCNVKIIDSFLSWDDNENDFIDARDKLLKVLKDSDNLVSQFSTSDRIIDDGYVRKWYLRDASTKETAPGSMELVIIFQNKGTLASKIASISQNASFRYTKIMGIKQTEEENNFLKINFLLMQVVQPVVRMLFDKLIARGRKLEEVISDIFYKDLEYQTSKKDKNGVSGKDHLQLSYTQQERMFHKSDTPTSKDLDLSLMIRILEENETEINLEKLEKEDIFNKLQKIKAIKKMINHSRHGEMQTDDFNKYWNILSKVVIGIRGDEEYQQSLNKLKTMTFCEVI